MPTEFELEITRVEINGKILPFEGHVDIKIDMFSKDEVGKRQLKYLGQKKGTIVLKGNFKECEPLSPTRRSRSWNMNIDVVKENKS